MSEEELTPKEKELFHQLRQDVSLEAPMEDLVVDALTRENLIRQKRDVFRDAIKWAAILALMVVVFFVGRYSSSPSDYNYVLLLHQNDRFVEGDPAERFSEYGRWMHDIAERGLPMTGEKLATTAVFSGADSLRKPQSLISGFFLIKASSEKEVMSLVNQSPHVKYGGTIEVRKIVNE